MNILKNYIIYALLFLYIVFLFAFPPQYINFPKIFFIRIIKYPLHLSEKVYYNLNYAIQSKNLASENTQMRREVVILKGQIVRLEQLQSENERLKKMLSFKQESIFDFLSCPVISKDSSGLVDSILIGAGKKQGIKENTVVTIESAVIGRVVQVFSDTSQVLLITDFNSRISALNSRSKAKGMLHGVSAGLCKLVYLPMDADIKKGDTIITSSSSSYFPKNLILGNVVEVATDPRGLSLYAIVKPEFDITRIEEVMCIK